MTFRDFYVQIFVIHALHTQRSSHPIIRLPKLIRISKHSTSQFLLKSLLQHRLESLPENHQPTLPPQTQLIKGAILLGICEEALFPSFSNLQEEELKEKRLRNFLGMINRFMDLQIQLKTIVIAAKKIARELFSGVLGKADKSSRVFDEVN